MGRFRQVDVFTQEKFTGNPVAVFLDADGLSDLQMARMLAWTNLSEATFVQTPTEPGADYHVRIFSMRQELPFAGHPTIGTCKALLQEGLIKPTNGRIVQQCKAGLVTLDIDADGAIQFTVPRAIRKEVPGDALSDMAAALGCLTKPINGAIYDVGPVWLTMQFASASDILALRPDQGEVARLSRQLGVIGVQTLGRHPDKDTYETRTFAPANDIVEDPVCGSGLAATGALLRDSEGFEGHCFLRQGTVLDRAGRVRVSVGGDIKVQGQAVVVLSGTY